MGSAVNQAKHHDVSAPTAELPGLWVILAAAVASAAAVNPGPTCNESRGPRLGQGVMLHAKPSQKIRPVKGAPKKEKTVVSIPGSAMGRVETLVL